jgi:hypothetical protein
MSAKNVKTLRAAHESWNKRDFVGVVSNAVKGLLLGLLREDKGLSPSGSCVHMPRSSPPASRLRDTLLSGRSSRPRSISR